ncbi:hypothetical protein BDB00DRAFT_927347 [Zychaea mexicana]|uniref:uncharacterized protein n=1 Tax=Zychaea mexicana TaxID=64656 RepID=UPI0022FEDA13|nr:uncharacterized protein BDB00DRAFT_927347 [Zychaea mexicana]KAI9495749.1 hypothetical protein BDB00DRAFT_927347 [Zychaea mexicana]
MVFTPNKQLVFLKSLPTGYPVAGEHLAVQSSSTIDLDAPLQEGQVLLKVHLLAMDPFMRGPMRLSEPGDYFPSYTVGQPIYGITTSTVLKSTNPRFKKDDLVVGMTTFEEYTIVSSGPFSEWLAVCNEAKTSGLPLSYYVGILGMPGHTAYAGLLEVGKPKKGETLFVSGASGTVGQLVGQMGKLLGLHVVGSAGSDEKCAFLKEAGFDGVVNYKTDNMREKLAELCPNGVDVYFDNVGGETLEAAIERANRLARFVCCGMASTYNAEKEVGIRNLFKIIPKHITLEGFAVTDYSHLEGQFKKEVTQWLLDEKIKYRETITDGFDEAAQAFVDVMHGRNFGKQVVFVSKPSF